MGGARWFAPGLAAVVLTGLACGGGGAGAPPPAAVTAPAIPAVAAVPLPAAASESELLDSVFRVDVERAEVVFDIFPSERRVQAQAAITFRMRPGQTRPILHLEAAQAPRLALRLNGEELDPARAADVRLLAFAGSGEVSVELQRDLAGAVSHRLEASYPLTMADADGRFYADVNDIEGRGNETLFPALNTPHELAHHVLTYRVHAAEPYVAVGSGGLSARTAGDVQEWVLDTGRPVAAYTVMFHLAPARTHALSARRIGDVDVQVLAPSGGVTADEAFAILEPWLAELDRELGPFPMPRGLDVVLTQGGGGMEYYGATTTSLRALRHEVFHMYFACSTIARTYRDSWWDEAITMWYELSVDPAWAPIAEDYRSDIVSGRSAVAVGFDRRAYDQGARIIHALAQEAGGRARMVAFLRDLHARRQFDPMTTWDLADEFEAWSGADVRARLERWLYQPAPAGASASEPSPADWLHHVDLRLPRP